MDDDNGEDSDDNDGDNNDWRLFMNLTDVGILYAERKIYM